VLNYFLKYKEVILRSCGVFLLLLGFVIHFWSVPQKEISQNELAAVNLARMEASVNGGLSQKKKSKPDVSQVISALKAQQEKQREYLTILSMILGVSSLAFSFLKKKQE